MSSRLADPGFRNYEERHNLSRPLVAQVYAELRKVLGDDIVVIGGRAVTILCGLDYRRTNDIDFLVDGSMTKDRMDALSSMGWKMAPNSKIDGDRAHFEKSEFSHGGRTYDVMIDINTVEGKRSLPGVYDKHSIIDRGVEVSIVDGPYFSPVKVASVPALIATKLTAFEDRMKSSDSQKRKDAITHMEDIFMLIHTHYTSFDAFLNAESGAIAHLLGMKQLERTKIDGLRNVFEGGRNHTCSGAVWVIKEKVRIDAKRATLQNDTNEWLANELDRKLRDRMVLDDEGNENYPETLKEKFDSVYYTFWSQSDDLDTLVDMLNSWMDVKKDVIRSELKEMFEIVEARHPDWKASIARRSGNGYN